MQGFEAFVELSLQLFHAGLAIEIVHLTGIFLEVEKFPCVDIVAIEVDELVAVGADAVVAAHVVLAVVLVVISQVKIKIGRASCRERV